MSKSRLPDLPAPIPPIREGESGRILDIFRSIKLNRFREQTERDLASMIEKMRSGDTELQINDGPFPTPEGMRLKEEFAFKRCMKEFEKWLENEESGK